ncbi:MAG: DUF5320 domain-containing protein [Candidatus Krumholzibacteriota bacterium]|nr:DUF5320 domain-containing protein [Candidatus Krumholzibacteriota bacterium]
MPRGDRKGPAGEGPMTGRGAGYCSGNDQPGFMSAGSGMGLRRGGGPGAGRMNRFNAGQRTPGGRRSGRYGGYPGPRGYRYTEETAGDEKSMLSAEAEILQKELDAIKKRLESLNDKKK